MQCGNSLLAACVFFIAAFLGTASLASEAVEGEATNNTASPEFIEALLAIKLDKEQRAPFGTEVRRYSADMQAAIIRITRQRNPDQPRAIRRKTKSITKTMDKAMRKILREDQWPAYEAFKVEFAKPPELRSNTADANPALLEAPAQGY